MANKLPSNSSLEIAEKNGIVKMVQAVFFPYKCKDLYSQDAQASAWVRWKLAGLVGEWRARHGAIKGITKEQMGIEVKYLADYFPDTTIAEVKWAMDMYTTGEIELEWNAFSCQFMSNVLQEMMSISQKMQKELVEKIPLKEVKATPLEKAESMKEMIIEVKKQLDNNSYVVYMINDVFNFLRRTKRLVLTDKMIEKGKKFAEQKIASAQKPKAEKEFKTLKAMLESGYSGDNRAALHRSFGHEYCVTEYFKKHPIEKVLETITEKEFI